MIMRMPKRMLMKIFVLPLKIIRVWEKKRNLLISCNNLNKQQDNPNFHWLHLNNLNQ